MAMTLTQAGPPVLRKSRRSKNIEHWEQMSSMISRNISVMSRELACLPTLTEVNCLILFALQCHFFKHNNEQYSPVKGRRITIINKKENKKMLRLQRNFESRSNQHGILVSCYSPFIGACNKRT